MFKIPITISTIQISLMPLSKITATTKVTITAVTTVGIAA